MEKILEAAHRLGHLLKKNEIVKRYHDLGERLEKDEEAKKLLDDYIAFSKTYREKEEKGAPIEVAEKQKLAEFQKKLQENELITQFMATQAYYMTILQQVNEAIADPKGDPPRESPIITPDEDRRIIL